MNCVVKLLAGYPKDGSAPAVRSHAERLEKMRSHSVLANVAAQEAKRRDCSARDANSFRAAMRAHAASKTVALEPGTVSLVRQMLADLGPTATTTRLAISKTSLDRIVAGRQVTASIRDLVTARAALPYVVPVARLVPPSDAVREGVQRVLAETRFVRIASRKLRILPDRLRGILAGRRMSRDVLCAVERRLAELQVAS